MTDGGISSFGVIIEGGETLDEFDGSNRRKFLRDEVAGRECVLLYFSKDFIKFFDPVKESWGSPSYHIRKAMSVARESEVSTEGDGCWERVLCFAECHSSRKVG